MKVFGLLLLLLLPPSAALADTAAGQNLAMHGNDNGAPPCAACHGMNGGGNAAIGAPALAGLSVPVIKTLLGQFAAGQGGNAVMQGIAKSLSPDEISAVAAYYAGLKN